MVSFFFFVLFFFKQRAQLRATLVCHLSAPKFDFLQVAITDNHRWALCLLKCHPYVQL